MFIDDLDQFQTLIEHSSDIITVVDDDGTILYDSPAVQSELGYEQGELMGEVAFDYIHPDDADEIFDAFTQMIGESGATSERVEYRFRHADGSWIWLETIGSNRKGTKLDGYVLNSRNITERKEQQLELRQLKEQYETIAEHSSDYVIIVDDTGTVSYVSPSIRWVMGYDPEDVRGKSAFEFVYDEDMDVAMEAFTEVVENPDEEFSVEYRAVNPDGSPRWIEARGRNLLDEPLIEGVLVNVRDISERIQKERELQTERHKFEFLTEHLPDVVYRADPDSLVAEYVNQEIESIYGYTPGEWLDDPDLWGDCIVDEDRERVFDAFDEAKRSLDEGTIEYQIETEDGSRKWVRERFDWEVVDGEVQALVGIVSDITASKQQLRELRRLKKAIDTSPTAMYITDTEGRIEYINEGFTKMTGHTEEDALGQQPSILNSGEMDSEYFAELWETLLGGESWQEEIINRRKSGALYAAMQTISPVFDESGEMEVFVAVQVDVTKRRERLQQLLVVDRLLRHDLKNDLTIIRGFAEVLEKELDDDDLREAANGIIEQSDELLQSADVSRFITDILTDDIEPRQVDIATIGREKIEELSQQFDTASIHFEGPGEVLIPADDRISYVFEELVENAITHNDAKQPWVEVAIEPADEYVDIIVSDNGPGIPDVEYKELSLQTKFDDLEHGQGLGLWLVYWIVNRFDGRLMFETNEPRGTTVTVRMIRD